MQKKLISSLLFFVFCGTIFANTTYNNQQDAFSENNDERLWITVKASSIDERTHIASLGMTLDEVHEDSVSGIATTEIMNDLQRNSFEICSCSSLQTTFKALDHGYHYLQYPAMISRAQKLATENSDIISIFSVGKSIQGRELIVMRINTTEHAMEPSTKPGIIIIGNHHAREHITAEFCMELTRYLVEHKNEESIKALLHNRDIFIMPMANPDGVEYDLSTFPYKFHRKNMRPLIRQAIGVDLNRNYATDWGGAGASINQARETYCGAAPFSEPETHAIKTLIDSHPNIRIFISYHSYGKLILYPWGYTRTPIGNDHDRQIYKALTKGMAEQLPEYNALQAGNMYIVSGEATDWAYAAHGIFSLTVEMMPRASNNPNSFYPTNKNELAGDIANNIRAAVYAIEFAGAM